MEAIFLVCGAGGPQLKRNPLGSGRGAMVRTFLIILTFSGVPAVVVSQGRLGRELVAVGFNGGLFLLGGHDFQVTDDAPGVEADLSARIAGPVRLGVGGHYSTHGTVASAPLRIVAVFLEPQVAIAVGTKGLVRLGLRGGWVHRSIEVGTTTYKSSGREFGVEAAASHAVAGLLALEGGMTFDYLSLDSFFASGSTDTGTVFAIHMGCRLAFGR